MIGIFMRKNFRQKALIALVFFFAPLFLIFAAEPSMVTINTNLPGPYVLSKTGPVGALGNIYLFALGGAGLLALAMISYGGIKWMLSGGNPAKISEAREQITQALLGLLLLFGAYVILNTINPELTVLRIPGLTELPGASSTAAAGVAGLCPLPPFVSGGDLGKFSDIYGTQAASMESGNSKIWNSDDPNAQKNLEKVTAEWGKVQGLAGGFAVKENSIYRPLGYQRHFYDIKEHGTQLERLDASSTAACADMKKAVDDERDKHRICQGTSYANCFVAKPSGCSPHVMGKAIDITVSGISYQALDDLLAKNNIDLYWKKLPGDEFHFELRHPPAGCASN